jgi:hypothetical protein
MCKSLETAINVMLTRANDAPARRKPKARKYFTLVSRGPDDTRWAIEFGDYDRACVRQERDDMKDGHYCDHVFRILETADDQASIDAEVAKLNGA